MFAQRLAPKSCAPVARLPLMARPATKTTLARNLRYLMERRGWKQKDLERKSGVSQKTISNILREEKVPGLDTVELIAEAFGLNLWHLIMPSLIAEIESGTNMQTLFDNYIKASAKGQAHIQQVAEREADYETSNTA
jgi:transcriptional regulator with XRE-family HTH domain